MRLKVETDHLRHATAVELLSRPKLNGAGVHMGIGVRMPNRTLPVVYHLTAREGFERCSLRAFARGHTVRIKWQVEHPIAVRHAIARLIQVIRAPHGVRYDLASCNCETVARYVITGNPISYQIGAAAAVAIGGTLLWVATHRDAA